MAELKGLRIAILATDGVEESELTEPKRALEEAGAEVHVVAPHGGKIQAMHGSDKSTRIPVDETLDAAHGHDYEALVLPGGVVNADSLRMDAKAQSLVREIEVANKPIAVICHGPWLLVSAGLVRDRTLTSYHSLQDDIRNAGGHWIDQDVVQDNNWISSRGTQDLPAFNREMLALFERAPRPSEQITASSVR